MAGYLKSTHIVNMMAARRERLDKQTLTNRRDTGLDKLSVTLNGGATSTSASTLLNIGRSSTRTALNCLTIFGRRLVIVLCRCLVKPRRDGLGEGSLFVVLCYGVRIKFLGFDVINLRSSLNSTDQSSSNCIIVRKRSSTIRSIDIDTPN